MVSNINKVILAVKPNNSNNWVLLGEHVNLKILYLLRLTMTVLRALFGWGVIPTILGRSSST